MRPHDFIFRDGETNQSYLGDGVYASFDGYQIWLRTDHQIWLSTGHGERNEIALEAAVFDALKRYVAELGKESE